MNKEYILNLLQTWGIRIAGLGAFFVLLALFIQVAWNLALVPLAVPVCSFASAIGWAMFVGLVIGLLFLLKETK